MSDALVAIEAMSRVDEMADVAGEHGCRLIVLAEKPESYGNTGRAVMRRFPTRDAGALRRYVDGHRSVIRNVFSVTDTWGVLAAEIREEFGFPPFIPSGRLKRLRDKGLVEGILDRAGLCPGDSDFYPRIIKPRDGTGKVGIHMVDDRDEESCLWDSGLRREDYLSQPYFRGPSYSAEVWADGVRTVFMGVTNRILADPPVFLERVKSFPWGADTAWELSVSDWTLEVLRAVGYDLGLAHVEFIETDAGFRLVEINTRMAGALITPGILESTNFNPYRMVVEQALGLTPSIPERRAIGGGYSHVSVYADTVGMVTAVRGVDGLSSYPGRPGWVESRGVGTRIVETGTYRSRIGNVFATGPDACVAQDRAISAAKMVEADVEPR